MQPYWVLQRQSVFENQFHNPKCCVHARVHAPKCRARGTLSARTKNGTQRAPRTDGTPVQYHIHFALWGTSTMNNSAMSCSHVHNKLARSITPVLYYFHQACTRRHASIRCRREPSHSITNCPSHAVLWLYTAPPAAPVDPVFTLRLCVADTLKSAEAPAVRRVAAS